jgi:hypothetical protein
MSKALAFHGASIDFVVPYVAEHPGINFMNIIPATDVELDAKNLYFGAYENGTPENPEAIEHPHTQAREMMVHCEHPTAGDLYFQGCVTKMSETPGVVETPSPLLGEHNREIFGLTEEEEAQLKEEGVI